MGANGAMWQSRVSTGFLLSKPGRDAFAWDVGIRLRGRPVACVVFQPGPVVVAFNVARAESAAT